MPLIRCISNGKQVGWKWGESGKCYATREEALKQARAIMASQNRDEKPVELTDEAKCITKEQLND